MNRHDLTVQRSARFYTLGPDDPAAVREVWFVLHGYGQLAQYFLRHFRAIDDGTRRIVAPEALSRFYIKEYSRVGASWMTRDDRERDIADYVAYLDAVAGHVLAGQDRNAARITVLGFSQGAATASRWAAFGSIVPDRLICWAGDPAHDLPLATYRTRLEPLILVLPSDDPFLTPERLTAAKTRLDDHGLGYRVVPFEGGHHLEAGVLRALADETR